MKAFAPALRFILRRIRLALRKWVSPIRPQGKSMVFFAYRKIDEVERETIRLYRKAFGRTRTERP